jgi:glucose-6-phosphate 1-dehydrogenase
MAVATEQKPGEPVGGCDYEAPADALVVFGITGDLAKVMTFHLLYRLEARGLLNCPIVGVAGNDWSLDELRNHARSAIENTGERVDQDVFGRFADRLSYVQGDFTDPGTFSRVAEAIAQARTPVFYLEIPPFLFATVIKGLSEAIVEPTGQTRVDHARSRSTWSSPRRAAKARPRMKCCCTPRCRATAHPLRARTASGKLGGSCDH